MFLDDGVSRDSAPKKDVSAGEGNPWADLDADPDADSKYREVRFEQVGTSEPGTTITISQINSS